MAVQGDPNRFNRVDAESNVGFFVEFLDARKGITEDALIKQQIIEWMKPLLGRRVLDVGCGTGDDARAIAELVGPNGRVVGVDFSTKMLEEARCRAANLQLPLEFRAGDAMKLLFDDGSFDYVRAERVLIHLNNARHGLEEMIRVAASKGRVVASELDLGTAFLDSPYVEVTQTIYKALADGAQNGRFGRTLARQMREAGLKNVISQETIIHIPRLAMLRMAISGPLNDCVREERISAHDAERWMQHLEQANSIGELHAGGIVFTAAGEKP
jgi:ubiquinone/menaquinone biosynthesis C-methylase UbiE